MKNLNYLSLGLIFIAFFSLLTVSQAAVIPEAQSRFTISNISDIFLNSGETKTLYISIKNNGDISAYNVFFEIIPDNTSAIKVVGTTKNYFKEIRSNEEKTLNFSFFIEKNANEGSYNIPFFVRWKTYKGSSSEALEFMETLYTALMVSSGKAEIAIENIYTTPPLIKSGSNTTLNIILRNVGHAEAKSVKTTLQMLPLFSPINSDNRFYVASIPPNGTALISYNIYVSKGAGSGVYQFNLQIDYEDGASSQNHVEGMFSLIMTGDPPININNIELDPKRITPGSTGILQLTIINSGTEKIKDAKVRITGGDEILTETYQFIGTLNPDDPVSTAFGISIPPNIEIGNYGLYIEISYSDPTGQTFIKANIYEIKIFPKKPLIPEPYINYIYKGIGFIAIVGIIYFFLLLKSGGFLVTKNK